MVGNIVRKPLGFIFIVTAHMIFNAAENNNSKLQSPGQANVTGILGNNITLEFTFNVNITKDISFAVYKTGEKKISEYPRFRSCFKVFPKNASVFYHITKLTQNNSEVYWASLFDPDIGPAITSNKVQLIVQEEENTTTDPIPTKTTIPSDSGSSELIPTILVVTPVMLLAAVLLFLICCLVRTNDQQQEEPQRNSNPTVQESIEGSIHVPGPSLVYSVLDFPKRPPAVVESHPSETEYASVSYLPEKKRQL
ncbi:uncharacterized protein PAE49_017388 isoform 1-T2 [Odontesthes bonariensis]|uniref:uncharacterized protein LOC142399862 n=1 Tax=Odontesthes bonariensis TaxID=219752 RepID=UPI003F581AAF